MNYNVESQLPKSNILARDPGDPKVPSLEQVCPKPLWDLVQSHGGCEKITRQKIKFQLDQWKKRQANGPPRSERFRKDCGAAFQAMRYGCNSLLPQTQVLGRSPAVVPSKLDTCPAPLWDLIQKYGGYSEQKQTGKVTRSQINTQLQAWKKRQRTISSTTSDNPANDLFTQAGLVKILKERVSKIEVL